MDDYFTQSRELQSVTWVVWLIIIIVGNIVFMNFIIAVVNQSYENCMIKMVSHGYKVKVEMIIEREA